MTDNNFHVTSKPFPLHGLMWILVGLLIITMFISINLSYVAKSYAIDTKLEYCYDQELIKMQNADPAMLDFLIKNKLNSPHAILNGGRYYSYKLYWSKNAPSEELKYKIIEMEDRLRFCRAEARTEFSLHPIKGVKRYLMTKYNINIDNLD